MLLCLGTSVLSLHGVQAVGAAAIAFAAYVLVDPSSLIGYLGEWAGPLGAALLVAVAVAFGCGWVFGVRAVLLRGVRLPASVHRATLPYGVLLALLCGVLTLVCLLRFPGTNAWWAVMTVAVILQPTHGETRRKLRGRIAGTVLGGTVAALVVMVLPGQLVGVLLGVVASLAAVVLLLVGAPYWQYSLAVTVSVILLTFERHEALAGDLERVAITVGVALVTAAAVWLATQLAPDALIESDDAAAR